MKVKSESEVTLLSLTLRNPMECSPPGSSIHGIFQARVLEWGASAFSAQVTHQFAKAPGPLGFAKALGLWSGICTIAHCLLGSRLQPRDDGHPLGVDKVEFVTSDPLSMGPTSLPTCLQDPQNSDTIPGSWISACQSLPDWPQESGAGDVVIWKEDQRRGRSETTVSITVFARSCFPVLARTCQALRAPINSSLCREAHLVLARGGGFVRGGGVGFLHILAAEPRR